MKTKIEVNKARDAKFIKHYKDLRTNSTITHKEAVNAIATAYFIGVGTVKNAIPEKLQLELNLTRPMKRIKINLKSLQKYCNKILTPKANDNKTNNQ